MKTTYEPAPGAHIDRATAILLGATFQKIRKSGEALTPKALVDHARPVTSPTHALYEWDDAIAGENYREKQAGYYLRAVNVVIIADDPEEPIRVRAVHSEGSTGYEFTTRIMKNPDRRKNLVAKAMQEFKQWKSRWEMLEELAEIFEAAENIKRQ